jgi:hypothetical protein
MRPRNNFSFTFYIDLYNVTLIEKFCVNFPRFHKGFSNDNNNVIFHFEVNLLFQIKMMV